jgi:hypothetical protein
MTLQVLLCFRLAANVLRYEHVADCEELMYQVLYQNLLKERNLKSHYNPHGL